MKTQSRKAKRIRLGVVAIAASAAIVLGSVVPASAASYNINASLNCVGTLYKSDTYRPHSSGPSRIKLSQHDWWKSKWTLRTGLRVGTTQTTQTLEFPPSSRSTYKYRTNGGSTTLPSGSYAVNARVNTAGNGGCVLFPPTFKAILDL